MKGITSIFSSLIVTLVTLSLAIPLFMYFSSIYNNSQNQIGSTYNQVQNAINTQITVIRASNTLSTIFVYNYGDYSAKITKVIIGDNTYNVNYNLKPFSITSLYEIIKSDNSDTDNFIVSKNTTIILQVNGNYYYFS